jgi:hypothetical protein
LILVPREQEVVADWNANDGVILEIPACKIKVTGITVQEATFKLKKELRSKIDSGELVFTNHAVDLDLKNISKRGENKAK